jgi:hypothetical protein
MTPWEYLEDWLRSDCTKEMRRPEYITARMQSKFPGNYRVAKRLTPVQGWEPYYVIVFDDPSEETFFRLKYPK